MCFGVWVGIVQVLVWQNLRAGFLTEAALSVYLVFHNRFNQLFVIIQAFLVSSSKNILTDVLWGQSEKSQLQPSSGALLASSRPLTIQGILFCFLYISAWKRYFSLWRKKKKKEFALKISILVRENAYPSQCIISRCLIQ